MNPTHDRIMACLKRRNLCNDLKTMAGASLEGYLLEIDREIDIIRAVLCSLDNRVARVLREEDLMSRKEKKP